MDARTAWNKIIRNPQSNSRSALFFVLYAFMGVATKLTVEDRYALNPAYGVFITVGFIFAVLCICGTFIVYFQNKNTQLTLKKYKIQVIQ